MIPRAMLWVRRLVPHAVEAAGPQHSARLGFGQLRRNTKLLANRAHAALDNVTHAELSRDQRNVRIPLPKHEGGGLRNQEEAGDTRQESDHILSKAIRKKP